MVPWPQRVRRIHGSHACGELAMASSRNRMRAGPFSTSRLQRSQRRRGLVLATRKRPTLMNSPSQALVYALVAARLQTDESLEDADLLSELGLDTLDLVLLTIKREELEPENGAFPLEALTHARTIGDVVELVDIWSQRDTIP